MPSLVDLVDNSRTEKNIYLSVYENLLHSKKNSSKNVLEIFSLNKTTDTAKILLTILRCSYNCFYIITLLYFFLSVRICM